MAARPETLDRHDMHVYLSLLFVIISILATFLYYRKAKKPTNVVLLTGLSDSGKTALFTKIIFNKPKKSVTSLKENEASIKDLNLRLIDIPGTERLRGRYWEQYRSQARHVVFILDATTLESKLRDLSEYLYELLSDVIIHKNNIKFTICCNKQDLDGASKKDQIKTVLEKELTAIKATKTRQLGKASDEEEEDYLARSDSDEVSLDQYKVNLVETSVHNPDQLVKIIF